MTDGMAPPALPPSVPEPFFRRIPVVGFVILALGAVFFLYQVVAGGLTLVLAGGAITVDTVAWVRWATLFGQLLFILVPTLILTRLRYGALAGPLRLRMPDPVQAVLVIAGVFALQQVLQGYMILQESIPLPPAVERWVDMVRDMIEATYRILVTARTPGELVLVLFTVAVVPALSEELLFRGLVQRDLERATGGWQSATIAGVIFALYHMNPFSLLPLIALGVAFGLIVHRSGNTVLAMIAHFTNNALATVAMYLNIDEDFIMTAPQGGAEGGDVALNTVLFAVIFAGLTYAFLRTTRTSHTV